MQRRRRDLQHPRSGTWGRLGLPQRRGAEKLWSRGLASPDVRHDHDHGSRHPDHGPSRAHVQQRSERENPDGFDQLRIG